MCVCGWYTSSGNFVTSSFIVIHITLYAHHHSLIIIILIHLQNETKDILSCLFVALFFVGSLVGCAGALYYCYMNLCLYVLLCLYFYSYSLLPYALCCVCAKKKEDIISSIPALFFLLFHPNLFAIIVF